MAVGIAIPVQVWSIGMVCFQRPWTVCNRLGQSIEGAGRTRVGHLKLALSRALFRKSKHLIPHDDINKTLNKVKSASSNGESTNRSTIGHCPGSSSKMIAGGSAGGLSVA